MIERADSVFSGLLLPFERLFHPDVSPATVGEEASLRDLGQPRAAAATSIAGYSGAAVQIRYLQEVVGEMDVAREPQQQMLQVMDLP